MGALKAGKRITAIAISFAGFLLLLFGSFTGAENSNSAMSIDGAVLIQGVVRRVVPAEDMIRVKVRQGETLTIRVDRNTTFVDIVTLDELEKGQRVKVWYTITGKENNAVKVERLPELGC